MTDAKLVDACRSLGISLLEISKFVQVSDEVDVTCWGYNVETGQNYIYISPKALRLSTDFIALILRHEILHYAGYADMPHIRSHDIENLLMDVVINKILYLAYQQKMKLLCRRIYPKETAQNLIALARADLEQKSIKNPQLCNLWQQAWENHEVPNPNSLYYQLLNLIDERIVSGVSREQDGGDKAKEVPLFNPFSGKSNDKVRFRELPPTKANRGKFRPLEKNALKDVLQQIPYDARQAFSNQASHIFTTHFVQKKAFSVDEVSDFIRRLEIRQQLDETARTISRALNGNVQRQLYPYCLSRIGIIYEACGITKNLPIYFNKIPQSRKPRLAVYIDTSPSMDPYKEYEVYLVECFQEDFPTSIFIFAGSVEEISTQEFAQGQYRSGYSTSFDAIIEHLLTTDYDCGIIFTDGYSSVEEGNKERFRRSRRQLFTVYFGSDQCADLEELSQQTMKIILPV